MMMAEVENGVVTNVIVVDPDDIPEWCADWPVCVNAGIGWAYANGVFTPPPEASE